VGESSGKAREIDLGDEFGDVVVKANGTRVKISSDGSVVVHQAARDQAAVQVGNLDDGGVYVGRSAEDGNPLHAALADLPDYKTHEEALAAAEQLKSVHPTAHVPTPKELDKNLFENRNTGHLKGTFNTSGSTPGSVYRSSESHRNIGAQVQWFDDGKQDEFARKFRLPVRLVW
jgi:hypothetical protein